MAPSAPGTLRSTELSHKKSGESEELELSARVFECNLGDCPIDCEYADWGALAEGATATLLHPLAVCALQTLGAAARNPAVAAPVRRSSV